MYELRKLKDENIYYAIASSIRSHKDIIELLLFLKDHNHHKEELNIITDYRNITIKSTSIIEEMEMLSQFINIEYKSHFKHIKWASLSNDHIPTTGALLLNELIKGKGISYTPFTTEKKVISWMGLTEEEFENFKQQEVIAY